MIKEETNQNIVPAIAVARGQLSSSELSELIRTTQQNMKHGLAIVENVAEFALVELPLQLDPNDYQEGRIFNANGELHWRAEYWYGEDGKLNNGWRVVYIGKESVCPKPLLDNSPHTHFENLTDCTERETTIRLWGERRHGQEMWLEPRIPRLLDYPGLDCQYPAMRLIEYRRAGRVIFSRLQNLVEWEAG